MMSFEEWENKNNAALRREKILIAMIYTVISILAVAILSWIMFNSEYKTVYPCSLHGWNNRYM